VQVNLDPENDVENACPKPDLHGFKTGAVHIETVGKRHTSETARVSEQIKMTMRVQRALVKKRQAAQKPAPRRGEPDTEPAWTV